MPFSPLDGKKPHGSVKKPTTILLKFRKSAQGYHQQTVLCLRKLSNNINYTRWRN